MNIALLGFGVVGSGVYEWCRSREDLHVCRVLIRSDKPEIAGIATRDFDDILHDPNIDVVAEVMGGLHPAYEYVTAALKAGKHVVTANKALVAAYYRELTALADVCGKALLCTAAVGGGIPWLVNLARCKKLDHICRLGGIMNGTSNFIMDAMHKSPVSFPVILKKAQELGYAEADPSADIDGNDIRRKLVISANIAFDALLNEEDIPMFGIRTVTDGDIRTFQSRGFVCKLLAEAAQAESGVCAYIEPTLVSASALEAAVPANFNLITYEGEQIGRQSFYGQGAGQMPTAANVVQDCLTILAGDKSFYTDKAAAAALDGSAEAHPYYVRTAAPDDFLRSVTADDWGAGVITGAVNTCDMLAWARRQLAVDPSCFIAGIR